MYNFLYNLKVVMRRLNGLILEIILILLLLILRLKLRNQQN